MLRAQFEAGPSRPRCIGAVMLLAQLNWAVMPKLVPGPEVLPMQARTSSSHPEFGPSHWMRGASR